MKVFGTNNLRKYYVYVGESSETFKKSVDISFLKKKYNIRLSRSYKEQTFAPQTVHFSEELESTIPETVDELKTENQKLKKEIVKLKRQNSQMEINFEEKLEKKIDFLANINQQFGAENDQLIKNLDRFRKYQISESISIRSSPGDSGTESEIIPSKCLKGRKLKSKKIAKTNKEKRVFDNDSEEDTESDDEKNKKDARNEMKTIIKTINSEFSLNYDQTFTSANNSTVRMRNSGKLPKDLHCIHANNQQNNKKLRHIKAAKELFRKNNPNIIDYDKESLLRTLADRIFHSSEMFDTDEEDHSKTVLKHLLKNVLNPKSTSTKTSNWTCNEQENVIYDTKFVQTEGEDEPSFISTSSHVKLTLKDAKQITISKHRQCLSTENIKYSGMWCSYCVVDHGAHTTLCRECTYARQVAQSRNGDCLSDKYINDNTKLQWRCVKGHEWLASFGNLTLLNMLSSHKWIARFHSIKNRYCSKYKRTVKLYQNILDHHQKIALKNPDHSLGLQLDIPYYNYGFALEVQGQQHKKYHEFFHNDPYVVRELGLIE
ncbi:hypothetical protein Glove_707g80 [Diversispora epigaea]|uniref:Uncharacterized protein n=1 Tax=Diversispora epigaea TaxID=1348612 RepID=A0A397GA06_9GLOM|nr:hypothetical protein Glove_707g80 [Diversispora epigaea]